MKRLAVFAIVTVAVMALSVGAWGKSRGGGGPTKTSGTITGVSSNSQGLVIELMPAGGGKAMVTVTEKTKITVDGKSDPKHAFKNGEFLSATCSGGLATSVTISTKDLNGDGIADEGQKPAAPKK